MDIDHALAEFAWQRERQQENAWLDELRDSRHAVRPGIGVPGSLFERGRDEVERATGKRPNTFEFELPSD